MLNYSNGYRSGTFDKCNGRPSILPIDVSDDTREWWEGYRDGYTSNEQRIGPKPRSPLEILWLDIHRARYYDSGVYVTGNDSSSSAVQDTLEYLQRHGLLTLPPEPSRDEVMAYTVEQFGEDAEDFPEDYA